jgi:hypothetical protein
MGIDRFSPCAVNVILEGMGGAFEFDAILEQDPGPKAVLLDVSKTHLTCNNKLS